MQTYERRYDMKAETNFAHPRPSAVSALTLLALCGPVLLAAPALAQTASQAQPAAPASNAFRDHARQAGVARCATLYEALGQTLTAGSTYSVNSQWSDDAPDAHVVQGVVGMNYNLSDLKTQAAGVVLAAPAGQSCEGNMVRVAPFQEPCAQVVARLPQGSAQVANLSGTPLYQLGGNAGQALLVPNGNGCIVVSVAFMAG